MYFDEMENYNKMMNEIRTYQSCPKDALATLQFFYELRPDREDETGENLAAHTMTELRCFPDIIRDDDGNILVDETVHYIKEEIDDLFYYQHCAGFVRMMNRMKKLKEELMAAAWHPRRIERLLELGGEEALDNFAGV